MTDKETNIERSDIQSQNDRLPEMKMKIYVREEINRSQHDEKEDSYCTSSFRGKDGTDWNLFMIADGLSGHHGALASNVSVRVVRDSLTKTLQKEVGCSPTEALKKSLIEANAKLERFGTTYTTIDAVLLSQDNLYLAHMGDSRVYLGYGGRLEQVTVDEGDSSGPKNYIGCTYIANNSLNITTRVNQAVTELYSKGHAKPSEILLVTDGLMSRVTDEEINQIWADTHSKYYDPSNVLDRFVERIRRPQGKLSELVEDKIKRIVGGTADFRLNPGDSKDQMIKRILDAYVRGEGEELRTEEESKRLEEYWRREGGSKTLVSRIDNNLKYDDATMILVDLKDSVNVRLGELRTALEVTIPELLKKIGQNS